MYRPTTKRAVFSHAARMGDEGKAVGSPHRLTALLSLCSGGLAMFAAIRRASSRVRSFGESGLPTC